MATKTYPNILKYGVQASYDALGSKDSNVLYFCTDTKKIYKGDIDFTDSVVLAATKPATSIIAGKLYVIADTGTVEVYAGGAWHVVSYPVATTISASSDDVHVATAKAVYDAIQNAISGGSVVNEVKASATEGNITVVSNGEEKDVVVHGVVTTPSYDASTRKFTFPVVDGDDVVVELGKDIFIDPNANNRYENGNLYLYLNDGTGEGKAPTELVIPVTALVKDYFGDDTASIQVDVDNATHKVTAKAVLRADKEGFTNALKVSEAEGDQGLYVDLSAYATIAYVDGEIERAEGTADSALALAQSNQTAIGVLNGDVSTAGSVAKTVNDAINNLDSTVTQVAGADGVSAEVVQEDGKLKSVSVAIAAETYDAFGAAKAVQGETTKTVKDVEDLVAENAANLEALAAATTVWGTF